MTTRHLSALGLGLCVALVPHPAAGQGGSHDGAFIVRLGTDTTAIERFSRSGLAYSVEQVLRVPRTSLRHTHLQLTPAGEVAEIHLMNHQIGKMDAPLLGSTRLAYAGGDSARVDVTRGDSTSTRVVAARPGMIPSLPQSFLPYELAAMRLRAGGMDSTTVRLMTPAGSAMDVVVRRVGADSMTFTLPFLTYRAHVDPQGRILQLYQPLGIVVQRRPDVDVNALATAWSALDAAGRAMGPLSPLDSSATRLGKATLSVRYSRPKVRGRAVYGTNVPWDTVWRTGANDATVFTTDRDLVIGRTVVPAGSYTLFTLFSRSSAKLVLNKETMRGGEPLAGTDYDAAHDLARIDMTTRTLATPVEPLTIEVLPRGQDRGVLRIAWGNRESTVPVRVR